MPTPAVSQGGRPRQFALDDVLSKTLAVFWSRGYRNTTTRDLEAELGITQSSLYNAFGSKASLLDAVLDQYQAAVDHSLLGPLRQAQDGRAGLSAFFRDLGESMAIDGRGCLMVNLMADEAPTNPAIAARTLAHRDRVRASLRIAMNRLCGDLGAATVEHRTDLLLATTLGLNIAARGGASAAEIGRLVAGIEAEITAWSS
ncbi:MAG: TetR/AcrR family transcriptional regulator [Cellulomonas sp.]